MHAYYISTLLQVMDSLDISREQLMRDTGRGTTVALPHEHFAQRPHLPADIDQGDCADKFLTIVSDPELSTALLIERSNLCEIRLVLIGDIGAEFFALYGDDQVPHRVPVLLGIRLYSNGHRITSLGLSCRPISIVPPRG